MLSAYTPGGVVALTADRRAECPWCRNEWVYLCRQEPEGQWIPVQTKCDSKEIHELHRCEESIAKNKALRVLLQLEYND